MLSRFSDKVLHPELLLMDIRCGGDVNIPELIDNNSDFLDFVVLNCDSLSGYFN